MKQRKKKRSLTLLEIMIVIFLIGIIGSVIGYNVKGSLDEGRAFRSEQGASQLRDILLLEVAKGQNIENVILNKELYLEASGLAKDVKKILKDGWGEPYEITTNRAGTDILVRSKKWQAYQQKKKGKLSSVDEQDEIDLDDEL
jgi:general secretion pathway protein G